MTILAGALLRSKLFWLILAAGALWAHGVHFGNQHGSYARAYRAIVAELAAKNKELKALKASDEKETAAEDTARDAAHAAALKTLGNGPKATKAQAKLLNAIGE